MRSKIVLLSLASLLTMVIAAGGITLALFTAKTTESKADYTAGTLAISVDSPGTWSEFYDKMLPGDKVSKTLTLKNTGNLELEFVTVPTRSGALFSGAGKATVAVMNGTGVLAPGATQDVTVEVALPLTADNSYQEAVGKLDLVFQAFQTKNITTEAATTNFTGTSGTWDIYRFYDADGNLLVLNEANILSFTETRPDGSVMSFAIDSSADPNFYFNNTRAAGTYTYKIMGKDGVKYTGTIVHPHP